RRHFEDGSLDRHRMTDFECVECGYASVKWLGRCPSCRRVRVKPLSPQERRIVHLALHDDPDVRTFSVGESNYRSVIIAPVTDEDTDEAEDDRDQGDEYDDNGAPADNGSYDENGDSGADEREENNEPRMEAPETSEDASGETPPETEPAEQDAEDADTDEDDGNGPEDPKRFRTRRAVGRRGAVRKRRGTKSLASVSTEKEKADSGDAKEDASGDSNNS
ncbi:MAG: R3H domain-containing nucleic acid-binding protein, partial [Candidatus Hydrogenedentota bacterium]